VIVIMRNLKLIFTVLLILIGCSENQAYLPNDSIIVEPADEKEIEVEVVLPTFQEIRINSTNYKRYFDVRTTESNGFITSITVSPKSNFEIISLNYNERIDASYYDSLARTRCNAMHYPGAVGSPPAVRERLVDMCAAQSPSYSTSRSYNVSNTSYKSFPATVFNYQYPAFRTYSRNVEFTGMIRVRSN